MPKARQGLRLLLVTTSAKPEPCLHDLGQPRNCDLRRSTAAPQPFTTWDGPKTDKDLEFYELGRPSNLIAPPRWATRIVYNTLFATRICRHKIRVSAMTWDWPDRPCHAEGPTRAEATSSHNLSQARLHDLGQPRNCDFWAGPQLPPNPSRLGMVQKRTRIGSFTS